MGIMHDNAGMGLTNIGIMGISNRNNVSGHF